jgi:hypothetical protein
MAAKRICLTAIALAAALAGSMARANQDENGTPAREAEALADFLILAVKPEGDENGYSLVEIGDTKVDNALVGLVAKALPGGFLGLKFGGRDYDGEAERAQCRAACRANKDCHDVAYVPPSDDQPVGVCHLKRLIEIAVAADAVMAPVVSPDDAEPRTLTPPIRETPRKPPREVTPPPPRLPPITAETVPPPPRAEPTAPPRQITLPQPPPEPVPAIVEVPVLTHADPLPPDAAMPPERTRKPLPLWLALGAVAFMFGGAGLYWHSHRRRMLTRLSTRLVSNGLDRHKIAVETSDHPDIGLRFVIRQSAAVGTPSTRIDFVPAGA